MIVLARPAIRLSNRMMGFPGEAAFKHLTLMRLQVSEPWTPGSEPAIRLSGTTSLCRGVTARPAAIAVPAALHWNATARTGTESLPIRRQGSPSTGIVQGQSVTGVTQTLGVLGLAFFTAPTVCVVFLTRHVGPPRISCVTEASACGTPTGRLRGPPRDKGRLQTTDECILAASLH
jgi:hypothetical protein